MLSFVRQDQVISILSVSQVNWYKRPLDLLIYQLVIGTNLLKNLRDQSLFQWRDLIANLGNEGFGQ